MKESKHEKSSRRCNGLSSRHVRCPTARHELRNVQYAVIMQQERNGNVETGFMLGLGSLFATTDIHATTAPQLRYVETDPADE